jgi:hypothetical protein
MPHVNLLTQNERHMIYSALNDDVECDFVPQYEDRIQLTQSAIDAAWQTSQTTQDAGSAWQIYLTYLGLTGLTAWLETSIQESAHPPQ